MDFIRFNTENNEYIIELSKRKKAISYNDLNYIITITFKTYDNNVIFVINSNEKDIFELIMHLYEFMENLGTIYSNIIYLNYQSDLSSYFLYLSFIDNYQLDTPNELDEKLGMCIYESTRFGNTLRLYIEMTYMFLQDVFTENLVQLVLDIPNMETMIQEEFKRLFL